MLCLRQPKLRRDWRETRDGSWLRGLPAGFHLRAEFSDDLRVFRLIGYVLIFPRVGLVIVEFARDGLALLVLPLDVAVTVGAHGGALVAALGILAEGGFVPRALRILEQRDKARQGLTEPGWPPVPLTM